MVDGAESAYSGVKTAFKALLGDPQAHAQLKAGVGAAWDYVSDLENLPYLLGAMTPEKREKLAQAYERGDVETIGRITGETVASLPIGGGAGTIKNVGKAAETALDAAQLAKKAEEAANVASEFLVAKHGDMPSPRPGQNSHHGVMSAWMEKNFPEYDPDLAPAVLMPEANHRATFGVYNTWRAEMRKEMGGVFDWTKVSEINMRSLSEKMFDAAKVPTIFVVT